MKLVTIERLQALHFEDQSQALYRRLRDLARRGSLPGAQRVGARWFIDVEAFAASRAPAEATVSVPSTPLRDLVERARAARGAQQ